MTEYIRDEALFFRKTLRRLCVEICIVLVLATLLYSSKFLSDWINHTIIVACLIYVLGGLALYPSTLNQVSNSKLYVGDKKLIFLESGVKRNILFSDINDINIKGEGDLIVVLSLSNGEKIEIAGYLNMEGLCSDLKT